MSKHAETLKRFESNCCGFSENAKRCREDQCGKGGTSWERRLGLLGGRRAKEGWEEESLQGEKEAQTELKTSQARGGGKEALEDGLWDDPERIAWFEERWNFPLRAKFTC